MTTREDYEAYVCPTCGNAEYMIAWDKRECAEAERYIADHPDGSTLHCIAWVSGGTSREQVSRERVRQIEAKALKRFRSRLALVQRLDAEAARERLPLAAGQER